MNDEMEDDPMKGMGMSKPGMVAEYSKMMGGTKPKGLVPGIPALRPSIPALPSRIKPIAAIPKLNKGPSFRSPSPLKGGSGGGGMSGMSGM